MKTVKINLKFLTICLIGGILSGCAGTPNPDLVKAETLFKEVNSDPQVLAKAPVPLVEAEESLTALKQLVDDGGCDEEIARLSYTTQLKTKIAREKANTGIAKEVIAKAEVERKQVLIDARTTDADRRLMEANAARLKAEQALKEAEAARLAAGISGAEAEQQRLRAEELARLLSELQARPTERGMVLTMGDVLFDFNKSNVKAGGMRIISKLAEFLKKYPERNLQIEGHTDSIGSDAYNQQLSERRAEAVEKALIYKGIDRNRMTAIGYGEAYPVASNASSSGQQQNRRVEIILSDEKGEVKQR